MFFAKVFQKSDFAALWGFIQLLCTLRWKIYTFLAPFLIIFIILNHVSIIGTLLIKLNHFIRWEESDWLHVNRRFFSVNHMRWQQLGFLMLHYYLRCHARVGLECFTEIRGHNWLFIYSVQWKHLIRDLLKRRLWVLLRRWFYHVLSACLMIRVCRLVVKSLFPTRMVICY